MRKVFPYIASRFRKDKIWLRRSKPSKRQYQILIAVDDSASMADNHSKQLTFESLALVSNALALLESCQLCVCSFGKKVRLLHPFSEQFTNQSGAKILQQLNCKQTKNKYGTPSILDIKVETYDLSGKLKEIKTYMEMFPFPFYVILRDINTLPQLLSDALRQWFELVTSSNR